MSPPYRYARVCAGVHRSGFPTKRSLPFLQALQLRTLLCLADTPYDDATEQWIRESAVTVVRCELRANEEPLFATDHEALSAALSYLLSEERRPVLVHCLAGQRATGVLIGCMRRTQRWSLTAIFDEYRRYADKAASLLDLQTIELFDLEPFGARSRPPGPGAKGQLVPSARIPEILSPPQSPAAGSRPEATDSPAVKEVAVARARGAPTRLFT